MEKIIIPEPGEACDCSGLVKASVMAGGEPNPNIGSNDYGTQNVVENTEAILDLASLQDGNLIFFNTVEGRENSHVGIVSSINKDENGNPVSVLFIHSGSSTGPDIAPANLDGTNYWGSRLSTTPFRKWDTIPDKNVTYSGGTLPTHIVNGSSNSIQRPKIF